MWVSTQNKEVYPRSYAGVCVCVCDSERLSAPKDHGNLIQHYGMKRLCSTSEK